jgi:hypothetical protein
MRCSASLSIVVFPLLLLYAARLEFRSSSPPRAVERDLRMTRLSACNVRTMVEEARVHHCVAQTIGEEFLAIAEAQPEVLARNPSRRSITARTPRTHQRRREPSGPPLASPFAPTRF